LHNPKTMKTKFVAGLFIVFSGLTGCDEKESKPLVSSGSIYASDTDVLLLNGLEVEFNRVFNYFPPPRLTWGPIDNPATWKVIFRGIHPGGNQFASYSSGVEIYFPGSIPPGASGIYQLKTSNASLNENEASIKYFSVLVTNEPTIPPSSYAGWSTNGALEVTLVDGEMTISFTDIVIDPQVSISGTMKLK
jgi:hypothetical protein